jgi:hypothetical protein
MKDHPDINDTLRAEGPDAVRARHDKARKFEPKTGGGERRANGRSDEPPPADGPDDYGLADDAHEQQAEGIPLGEPEPEAPIAPSEPTSLRDSGHNTQRKIPIVPFKDIKLSSERRYLVKNLIPRAGLVVAWGPPKCGKSFWAFDLSMHPALGREYRGRRVQQGAVVYGAFEGQGGLEARVEAFRQHMLGDFDGDVPFYLEPMTLKLVRDHRALIAAIKRQLGDQKPVLVVLDTLNRSIEGSESNDEDMTKYIGAADAIREAFDCAVLIIHHCGVDGTRPRGHTSLTGAVDAQLAIARDQAKNVIVTVEYMKDGAEGDVIASRLDPVIVGKDVDGDDISSCVLRPLDDGEVQRTPKKGWPKSLRQLLEAMTNAAIESGFDHQIKDGPTVKAVHQEHVRALFMKRYVGGEVHSKERAAAAKRAWTRAVNTARNSNLIVGDEIAGRPVIWSATKGE